MPPRIDKGYLDNYSGSTQAILLACLRAFELIDEVGTIQPELREMATSQEDRKRHTLRLLETFYPNQLHLAEQNGTSQQLEESFRAWGIRGSTLRKAIVFYLDAVKYAGAPNSPHFKPPKQTGPSRSGTRQTSAGVDLEEESSPPPKYEGETITVSLGSAGAVSLLVNVRWLDLPDETFTALRKLTKDLRSLAVEEDDDVVPEEEDDP
jgi:hypothetical protein